MFTYPFEILKKRLTDTITQLREVDWYMNQDDLKDKNASLKVSPAAYIQMYPAPTENLGFGLQKATVDFDVILLTETLHDTGTKRLKKDTPQDHMRLFDDVYKNLSGFNAKLSYLPEFVALLNTANDKRIMNTISRINVTPPHAPLKAMMKSVQRFQCLMYDHAEFKQVTLPVTAPPVEVNSELT